MSSEDNPRFIDELLPAELVKALFAFVPLGPIDVGTGSLLFFEGLFGSRRLLVCAFDPTSDHGTIGRLEAGQLIRATRSLEPGAALILLMNTGGIRVTDNTQGIASLRFILKEAQDARLRGVRMLAAITKQAFGGASLLASHCERRLVHDRTLFAMSGPRLIEQTVGKSEFDADNKGLVYDVLGGRARAAISTDFRCLAPSVTAYRAAIRQWLEEIVRTDPQAGGLQEWGRKLEARLDVPIVSTRRKVRANTMRGPTADVLRALDPQGWELESVETIVIGRSVSRPGQIVFVLASPGCGFREAVLLGQELSAILERTVSESSPITIVLDAESHASTRLDEGYVLSEALAFLAIAIRTLVIRGERYVRVVVSGQGGGGIQGAVGSAASSVSMTKGARLRVLPQAAMKVLNKAEESGSGSLEVAISAGAVDAEFVDAFRMTEGSGVNVDQSELL